MDEIIQSSFEFCARFEATPEQTKRFQIAVEKFFREIGLDYGKQVYFPEYIEGWKRLATSDLELWAQNQRTVIQDLADSVFDMLDKDGSGGISLEEWARHGSMFGIFPSGEDAERSFRKCDLDANGKLGVAEMTRQNLAFWYTTPQFPALMDFTEP